VLERVIGKDADVEEFWDRAEQNLRNGALRLLFVADDIPTELRAIIEFLNGRMPNTDVYGVEVRRYEGDGGAEAFVPRLVGAIVLDDGPKHQLTSLDEKLQTSGPDVLAVADRLRQLGSDIGLSAVSAPTSLQMRDEPGTLVWLYPELKQIGFPLTWALNAGCDKAVAEARSALEAIAGKPVGQKEPSLGCGAALAKWDEVEKVVQDLAKARKGLNPDQAWMLDAPGLDVQARGEP
jgi:hypothetical protein